MAENLIRCFIAVELPDNILKQIAAYTRHLSEKTSGVRWVRPEGIHLTLKFLGEINAARVEEVKTALTDIKNITNPFDLIIRGSGCFPNRRQPKVIWLGLEHDTSHSLFKLHDWLDVNLAGLGFEREKRRFSPHLTLGRVKNMEDFGPLFRYIDQHPFPDKVFRVDKVYYIRSTLQPSGAIYTTIADYPLKTGS